MLLDVLRFARDTVPFHRARIPSAVDRVSESDVHRLLLDVPPMTKDDLRERFDLLWSTAVPSWRRRTVRTGGSTGAPVPIGLERGGSVVEWAFITSIWGAIGFRPGERRLMVRGLALHGDVTRERPLLDELQLSAFHLSDQHLRSAWARIRAYRPRWLHGYPSAVITLLLWDPEAVGSLGVRGVLAGSEPMQPWQRRLVADRLGVPIAHWYGHSERVLLGDQCPTNQAFHLFPRYGHAEVIRPDGTPAGPGEEGELIGTGLLNRAMPLIRYRTEDLAVMDEAGCSGCGRSFQMVASVRPHRRQEFLIGRSGGPISVAAINFHDGSLAGVAGLQYVQDVPGSAALRLQAGSALDPSAIAGIGAALESKFAGELSVRITQVESLERQPSGKVPLVIQRASVADTRMRRLVHPEAGPR